ncbi:MAG: hypothetical protein PQ963_10475 [Methanobacterium sp.]|jgi:hypothetical protein
MHCCSSIAESFPAKQGLQQLGKKGDIGGGKIAGNFPVKQVEEFRAYFLDQKQKIILLWNSISKNTLKTHIYQFLFHLLL